MNSRALKAYLVFFFTALMIYAGTFLMVKAGWITRLPSYTLQILFFLLGITALIYKYITRFGRHGAAMETQFYLGSIALKLLVGGTFIAIVMAMDKPQAGANAVLFLVSYILFTTVEILQLIAAKKG